MLYYIILILCFIRTYILFSDIQEILMNHLMNLDRSLSLLSQDKLIRVLLYGSDASANKKNRKILIYTVKFIKTHKHLTIPFSKSFLLR